MTVVNVHEAKTNLSRLIEQALRGEEVVIARNGVPAVKLVQVEPETKKPKRKPGQLAGLFVEIDPDWWKPDDDLADLFEGSEEHGLLTGPSRALRSEAAARQQRALVVDRASSP